VIVSIARVHRGARDVVARGYRLQSFAYQAHELLVEHAARKGFLGNLLERAYGGRAQKNVGGIIEGDVAQGAKKIGFEAAYGFGIFHRFHRLGRGEQRTSARKGTVNGIFFHLPHLGRKAAFEFHLVAKGSFRKSFDQIFPQQNIFGRITYDAEGSAIHIGIIEVIAQKTNAGTGAEVGIFLGIGESRLFKHTISLISFLRQPIGSTAKFSTLTRISRKTAF
jgi:hypothetical protein